MTFERYLHWFSVLLIFTGFFAILITGSYPTAVGLGMTVTVLYACFGERLSSRFATPRWVWNAIALLLLGYYLVDTFYGEQDLVGNGIKFVVYLQAVKLLSPKTARDHLQIYLLSFLHILASTVISNDISFAPPFILYIVVATWTLALFNLKLQQEASVPDSKRAPSLTLLLRSKDIITRGFLVTTSLLSLSIIAVTMVVFFLFPRLSLGQFFKRVALRQHVSGFSETVELGSINNIKTNDAVAFRVELSPDTAERIDPNGLYWRGTATDHFDGRRWTKTEADRTPVRIDTESGVLSLFPDLPEHKTVFRYRVFLEAMSTPILFGADRLYRVTWEKPVLERLFRNTLGLQRDTYGGFYFLASENFLGDLTYTAESVLAEFDSQKLEQSLPDYPFWMRKYYLQLPELNPDVRRVLDSIASSDRSLYSRALTIQNYIEKNYAYTLDVQDAGTADPVRFFFVEKKAGHCEYFSTALALALRYHGIPARQVVGYRGGEMNPYGNYLAVRQSDAHTWVEAFFPGSGWIRLDATPTGNAFSTRKPRFLRLIQFVDYLRLRWNKYIIEYDLRLQAIFAERIGRRLADLLRSPVGGGRNPTVEKDEEAPNLREGLRYKRWVFGVSAALGIGAVAFFSFHRARRRSRGRLAQIERLLARKSYQRLLNQTGEEFACKVEAKEGNLPALRTLIGLYYTERYGGKEIPVVKWDQAIEQLELELAKKRKPNRKAA